MGPLLLFLEGIVIIVLVVGFILFAAGVILDILWGVKAKQGKKVALVHKIFAVLLSILGVIGFIVPLVMLAKGSSDAKQIEESQIADIDERYHASSSEFDTIEYQGAEYKYLEILSAGTEADSDTPVMVVIDPNNIVYNVFSVTGPNGTVILEVPGFEGLFVPADKYDEIRNYYLNEAPLNATLNYFNEDYDLIELPLDINDADLRTLITLHSQDADTSINNDSLGKEYTIHIKSEDTIYDVTVELSIQGDNVILVRDIYTANPVPGVTVPADIASSITATLTNR